MGVECRLPSVLLPWASSFLPPSSYFFLPGLDFPICERKGLVNIPHYSSTGILCVPKLLIFVELSGPNLCY